MLAVKTYKDAIQKRIVQKLLFDIIGAFNGIATVLIGPTPLAYIKLLKELGVTMIIGYENNPAVDIDLPGNHRDIQIVRADICEAVPSSFMDIDLITTIKTSKYLLIDLFNKQKAEIRNRKKVFMFTVAMRGVTKNELIDFLSELLEQEVVEPDERINVSEMSNVMLNQYFFTTLDSSPYTISGFSYRSESATGQNNGSRMMSILIQYK